MTKIVVGVNDLATTRPDVAKILMNSEDGTKYVAGASAYVWFKCPVCGELAYRQIADMCRRDFVCPACKYGGKQRKHPRTLSQEIFLSKLHSNNPNVFTDDEYINNKTDMNFYCNNGHHWQNRADAEMYNRSGCPFCSGRRPIIGETDVGTTRPDVAKLLKYPERAILYKEYSNQKEWFICPNCGKELYKFINNVSYKGLSCDRCGDGLSYPNKFMANVLTQLGLKYKPEYNINTEKYKYDFFLMDYNTIIEMHGKQHYEESGFTSRTLEEEKENDNRKYEYAMKNNINSYIVIDSKESRMQYIKNSILKSHIADMFDLSCINWNECELFASGTMVTAAADLYKKGYKFNKIMDELHASKSAVTSWLNKADNMNLIHWDKHNGFKDLAREIILLNTKEIFSSVSVGAKAYGVNNRNVASVCNYKRNYAGIHPDSGLPLVWRFLDKYDENEVVDFSAIKIRHTKKHIAQQN